jgi:hypothetical protein
MEGMAAGDATAVAYLPRDLLCDILLRLSAFHLRGLRNVCKEWREVVSSLVDAHKVRRPRTPTHTVVLSQGRTGGWPTGSKERVGRGFLFDEQWRFTAWFTVDPSARLIGTCNSLLFFLLLNDAIKVVEPLRRRVDRRAAAADS